MNMSLQIDDTFIRRWEPRFDERAIGGEYESGTRRSLMP
jgi:hypothetical protein